MLSLLLSILSCHAFVSRFSGYAGLGGTGLGLSATPYGVGQQSAFGMGVGVQQPIVMGQQQPIMQQLMQQQQEIVQPQLDVGFSSQYGTGMQTPALGLGQQMWMPESQANVQAMLMQQQQPVMQQSWQQQGGLGEMELGGGVGQQWGGSGLGFGGVGSFGAVAGLGASKKTTTAAPIFAQSMVVPKIITQPILRPHAVTQPIVQQQLIQQPIVETRQVIQPVIRRIITQPSQTISQHSYNTNACEQAAAAPAKTSSLTCLLAWLACAAVAVCSHSSSDLRVDHHPADSQDRDHRAAAHRSAHAEDGTCRALTLSTLSERIGCHISRVSCG